MEFQTGCGWERVEELHDELCFCFLPRAEPQGEHPLKALKSDTER